MIPWISRTHVALYKLTSGRVGSKLAGKPGKVQIKILGVWQQQAGNWKLLARQAVRVAA